MNHKERLSKNFDLSEFLRSNQASEQEIRDELTDKIFGRIQKLVDEVLQPLRDHLGKSVEVTSGFRPDFVNSKVGGSDTSFHLFGSASDIKVEGKTAKELQKIVRKLGLPVVENIAYKPEDGGHLHLAQQI